MAGPRLLGGLADVFSSGKQLYDKVYSALSGESGSGSDYGIPSGGYGSSYSEDDDFSEFNNFGNIFPFNDNNSVVEDDGPRTEPDIYSENIAITCNEDPKIYCRKGVIKVVSRSNINSTTAKKIVDTYIGDRVKYGFKIKRFEFDEDKEEIYVTLTKPGVKLIHTFDLI